MSQNKSFFVLLNLQVKSMLSLYFLFTKKRFFFNLFFQKFNCFNTFMHNNIFLSMLNRQKVFFGGQNKDLLAAYKSTFSLMSTRACLRRFSFSRSHLYLNQLFYTVFKYQRLLNAPV